MFELRTLIANDWLEPNESLNESKPRIVLSKSIGYYDYKGGIEPKNFIKDAWRLGFVPAFTEEYFIQELREGNYK